MKIFFLNAVPYGSTGNIVKGISKVAKNEGHATLKYFSWTKNYKKSDNSDTRVGKFLGKFLHINMSKITGNNGCYSKHETKRIIKEIEKFKPDIINLHILHSWYVNLPLLFEYLKKTDIKIVWTFHDCWAFTGQCPYFDIAKCDKWKNGCYECPQYKLYPMAYVDKTKKMYKLKKEWFTGIENMTIVTPSKWLASLIPESFMKEYSVKVINNGIDLEIFKLTESNFREKYGIAEKKIVLGVAFDWGKRKGLDVFCELAKRLPDNYQIVLVGTDDNIDKELPSNIISIHRTSSQRELAEIYSASDVFANPTREDNFPTVNMEALACGTPIVTFKTGGSPEILDETCGTVVDVDDIDSFEREIFRICEDKPYSCEACVARAQKFNRNDKFKEYVELFDKIIK